ncbi:MAG: nitrilase [Anaerolineae bacterium]|nr:nitrilase [Anaerolineae bacterium]
MDAYKALALQTVCNAVNGLSREAARERMMASIKRLATQIRTTVLFIGRDCKLVVLPEYFLTGFPMGESLTAWRDIAALEMDGPEYAALSKIAQDNQLFLSGNAYEQDPHFPSLYFQTSFVIAPNGNVVLRYRRLNSMFAPTPHDVWDKYLEIYGLDGVFAVADTEIGKLAAIASEEILYPELARCLMMRGAEVFLHSSSEVSSPLQTPKDVAKKARAIENMAYVVSANSGGIVGSGMPGDSTSGGSQIVDYNGNILAQAAGGESMVAHAEVDLLALRRYRQRPGMGNYIARQRFELYASSYAVHSFYPANSISPYLPDGVPDRTHFVKQQQAIIERLHKLGVI